MGQKISYDGPKRRGGHTSIIPMANKVIKAASKMKEVAGIAPGFIDGKVRSRMPRIEYKTIPIGLEITVLGNSSKQTIMIFTQVSEIVKSKLEKI